MDNTSQTLQPRKPALKLRLSDGNEQRILSHILESEALTKELTPLLGAVNTYTLLKGNAALEVDLDIDKATAKKIHALMPRVAAFRQNRRVRGAK